MNFLFHLAPWHSLEYSNYHQHMAIALAEGLRELGCPFYANVEYWAEPDYGGEYLFKQPPPGFEPDVSVYTCEYFHNYHAGVFPNLDCRATAKRAVLLDMLDGLFTLSSSPGAEQFDVILRAHCSMHMPHAPNVVPWAFGLSNRIIKSLRNAPYAAKSRTIINNFRQGHPLRSFAVNRMDPVLSDTFQFSTQVTRRSSCPEDFSNEDAVYYRQTGARHDPEYYRLLTEALVVYAFGGDLSFRLATRCPTVQAAFARGLSNWSRTSKPASTLFRLQKAVARFAFKTSRWGASRTFVFQWDSWRFWEAMCATGCPIHLDFVEHGFLLPVVPEHGRHYWGVSGLDFHGSAHALASLSDDNLREIGLTARQWVLREYSPVAVATRFLCVLRDPPAGRPPSAETK